MMKLPTGQISDGSGWPNSANFTLVKNLTLSCNILDLFFKRTLRYVIVIDHLRFKKLNKLVTSMLTWKNWINLLLQWIHTHMHKINFLPHSTLWNIIKSLRASLNITPLTLKNYLICSSYVCIRLCKNWT